MENAKLQVYFHNELKKGLHNLEEFNRRSPMELNNALLGLYARNLYHEVFPFSMLIKYFQPLFNY